MEKFTVIITHYNQMCYVEEAIVSALKQNYRNIELIIADDCSKEFDKEKVKAIIESNNKNHFEYKILQGKKNVGTVKNLNSALKKATGDYIMFFAADDKLKNKKIISRFIEEFKDNKKNVITTQCLLYDEKLKKKQNEYVNVKIAEKLNKKNSKAMFEKMSEGCFYGAGGTAYRKIIFEKYGNFNEKYLFVEDWSYWLYILRNGEKIYYCDFDTLCHRDGGISHSTYTKETIPTHVKQYYKDILNIYENEVIPYINMFTTRQKYRILKQYNNTILYYLCFVPTLNKYLYRLDNVRLKDKKLKYYWKFQTIKKIMKSLKKELLVNSFIKKIQILVIYNKVIPMTFLAWLLSCIFIINKLNVNNNLLLLIYIIDYFILYNVIYITNHTLYYIKLHCRKKEK